MRGAGLPYDSSLFAPRRRTNRNVSSLGVASLRLASLRLAFAAMFGLVTLLTADRSEAAVRRFAVLIGNNEGASVEMPLRYAESDAQRVAAVLRELGGVQPADLSVLTGESEDTVRRTLITTNARISQAQSVPGTEVMLTVYCSGHADGEALHLGNTSFSLTELSELVRGSPAKVRLLIVDACRSGSLTRVKGGHVVPAFNVADQESLRGEGMALLTASAAGEDAQESDAIGGSFFTHALVSGLRGAADRNHDGAVALDEIYAYAYGATLRATSVAASGSQHPTFHFDVRGFGSMPLAKLGVAGANRAWLWVPEGLQVLVLAQSERGEVVAEVGAHDEARRLSLRSGRYFLRVREKDHLLEGTVELADGAERQVEASELTRYAYAQLVRKGGGEVTSVASFELGGMARAPRVADGVWCFGVAAAYGREWSWGGLRAKLGACTDTMSAPTIRTRENEYSLGIGAGHTWDFGAFGVTANIGPGGGLTHQMFDTYQSAPTRLAWFGNVTGGIALRRYLGPRWYVSLEPQLEAQLFRYQPTALDSVALTAATTARTTLWIGLH